MHREEVVEHRTSVFGVWGLDWKEDVDVVDARQHSPGECLHVHDVRRPELAARVGCDGEADVRGQADTRGGHIQLTVAKARLRQVDTNALQRLSLSLVYRHGKRDAHLQKARGMLRVKV